MIHKVLKKELDSLKEIVALKTNASFKQSYGDVINFLVNYYKQSKRIEYPIEEKTRIAIPLQNVSLVNVAKLDGKTRVSYDIAS